MGILRADRITGLGGANAITGSAKFFGSNYISVGKSSDFALGTGDWTVEYWAYPSSVVQYQRHFYLLGSSGSNIDGIFANDGGISFGRTNVWAPSAVTHVIQRWNHYALVHDSTNMRLYINGTQVLTSTDNFGTDSEKELIIGYSNSTFGGNFDGYISNFRIENGFARYTSAFTPPNTRLTKTENTTFLGLQSSGNVLQEETGKVIVLNRSTTDSTGPIASRFTPNSPVGFSTTTDVGSQYGSTFDGFGSFATSTYMVPPKGKTTERNRGRAVFTGGYNAPQTGTTEMEFFNIQSGGLTEEFGNQSINRKFSAGLASATRGVTGGSNGTPSWVTGTMEFVTIANASNTTTFGNMTAAGGMVSAHSNDTRGLFFSVWDASGSGPAHKGHIDYITIATTGNSADFGQLSVSRPEAAGFGSPTRGICAGGYPAADGTTMSNVIDYVTISTLGNATDFGDLTQARQAVSGASSQTRGVVAGGYVYGSPAGTFNINTIDYITIATTGDALDFGDLIVGAMAKSVGNCSDQTRGVFTGGKTAAPTYINTIEIVTIATTGNASDFGDLKRTRAYGSVFCDSHGGLS